MGTILLVGADTVAGANVAARLAHDSEVRTLPLATPVEVPGCTAIDGPVDQPIRIVGQLAAPEWIVLCGPAAVSSWESGGAGIEAEFARRWAAAAHSANADLAYLSTDAVFDGPRLFQDETSSPATTPLARAARLAEEAVLAEHPRALVLRTHVFGWSPTGSGTIESRLDALAAGRAVDVEFGRHATPIHAGDLAESLLAARAAGLAGLWHAAGGERIDAREFVSRLAIAFEHPVPRSGRAALTSVRETSLRSTALARRVGLAPAMIDAGLARLLEERASGFAERLVHGDVAVPA